MKMKESGPRRGRPEHPLESANGNSLFFPFLIFIMIKTAKPNKKTIGPITLKESSHTQTARLGCVLKSIGKKFYDPKINKSDSCKTLD